MHDVGRSRRRRAIDRDASILFRLFKSFELCSFCAFFLRKERLLYEQRLWAVDVRQVRLTKTYGSVADHDEF